jgi:trk system potassium uptake protein TrkA
MMKKYDASYVVVAGCGRLGANIASVLSAQGKDVVVLDVSSAAFRKLSPDYGGFSIEGDATDLTMLERAGIEKAGIVVAATNDDNTNVMIAQIASKIFAVPKVISRLYDTEKEIVYQDYPIQLIYPSRLSILEFEKLIACAEKAVLK